MLRLNRIAEYGVLALQFIGNKNMPQSAREVADELHIPYEILAKTLQKLKDAGFLASSKGIHGGYLLCKPLETISVGRVVEALEGPVAMIECQTSSENHSQCERANCCEIRPGMTELNVRLKALLESMMLSDLGETKP